MIFLTSEEAERIMGLSPTKAGHGLIPVECEDGSYKLGEEVLDDPAFAHVHELLSSLPRGEDRPARVLEGEEAEVFEASKLSVWSAPAEMRDRLESGAPSPVADENDASALSAGLVGGSKGRI